jgi:hypothetical protein
MYVVGVLVCHLLSVNIRACSELTSCLASYHLKDKAGIGMTCAM